MKKKRAIALWATVLIIILLTAACASAPKKVEVERVTYKVALFNAGAYTSLYNQALADLGSHREIKLITGVQLDQYMGKFGLSVSALLNARDFDDVAKVKGLDFALVLMPSPAAYPSGHVGLKSINWRIKRVHAVPAVKVPSRQYDWVVLAKNGWVNINSNPPGAYLDVNGKPVGSAPVLMMAESPEMDISAQWTRSVVTEDSFPVEQGNIIVDAPEKYLAKMNKKGPYQSLVEADAKYGEMFFMGFYVVVLIAGIALLFYNPYSIE